eukprot:1159170-Pelagomonas_calceolata.AAC.1
MEPDASSNPRDPHQHLIFCSLVMEGTHGSSEPMSSSKEKAGLFKPPMQELTQDRTDAKIIQYKRVCTIASPPQVQSGCSMAMPVSCISCCSGGGEQDKEGLGVQEHGGQP